MRLFLGTVTFLCVVGYWVNAAPSPQFEVTFFDVGQGNATVMGFKNALSGTAV